MCFLCFFACLHLSVYNSFLSVCVNKFVELRFCVKYEKASQDWP